MTSEPPAHLSKRETEVLDLLAEGLGNKEIAARLGLSTETVRAYLKTIYGKLHVHSRLEAALKYRAAGEPLGEIADGGDYPQLGVWLAGEKHRKLRPSPTPMKLSPSRFSILPVFRRRLAVTLAIAAAGVIWPSTQATAIQKASTGTNLTTGTSWVGNTAPGANDTGLFDSVAGGTQPFTVPSGNPTWGNIQIVNPSVPISISVDTGTWTLAGNSSATTVIDMSAATQDLTIQGVGGETLRLSNVAGSYTFNVTTGRTFTLGNLMTLSGQSGTRTLTLMGGGNFLFRWADRSWRRSSERVDSQRNRHDEQQQRLHRFHGDRRNLPGEYGCLWQQFRDKHRRCFREYRRHAGGTGQIAPGGTNAITVASGGSIAPGTSIGTLTINSGNSTAANILNMSSGSTFKMELGVGGTFATPGTSDLLAITNSAVGDVSFNNNSINFLGTGSAGVFKLFDGLADANETADSWTGLTLSGRQITGGLNVINLASGLSAAFFLGDGATFGEAGDIYLQVIPEPSTAAMLLGGAGLLAFRRRRLDTLSHS